MRYGKEEKETQPKMNSCWKRNISVSGEQILKKLAKLHFWTLNYLGSIALVP